MKLEKTLDAICDHLLAADGRPFIKTECDPAVTLADGTVLRQPDFSVGSAAAPVCAFLYDGLPPPFATHRAELLEETAELTRWRIDRTTADGLLTLRVTLTRYKDFPAVEWLPELLNAGDRPSGVVTDFRSLAAAFDVPDRSTAYLPNPFGVSPHFRIEDVALRRVLGSKNQQSDFTPETVWLRPRPPENHLRLDTDEGRSSAVWLPFFGLDFAEREGANFAVGWSGRWYAEFRHDDKLFVDFGMPRTHFRVLPGECLRQVRGLVHLRLGQTVEEGQNAFRRLILRHYSPRKADGTPVRTPIPVSVWGGQTTDDIRRTIRKATENGLPYDTLWVDAGWFGNDREVGPSEWERSDWATTVGNWRVNRVPHPGGLRPVADAAHAAGMRFLLWVEMERVFHDAPVVREHPEWLLADGPSPSSYLLNLGEEGACQWAIDTIERLVREEGVDDYREDFNFNTIPYWEKADTPDRTGVAEMKFVAGLYRFWDTIRARHPDMLIDNCASGGRRIDLETISRSICLWRSDMLGRPWYDASGANQTHLASLTQWVPLHAGGTTVVSGDDYGFLSGVASGVDTTMSDERVSIDLVWLRELLAVSRRMRDFFFCGDFHVLTPDPASRRDFFAYQLHNPGSGEGFFIVFRRPEGDEDERVLRLRQIDASARYRLEPFRGEPAETSGAALAHYRVALPEPRSVFLCFYRPVRD